MYRVYLEIDTDGDWHWNSMMEYREKYEGKVLICNYLETAKQLFLKFLNDIKDSCSDELIKKEVIEAIPIVEKYGMLSTWGLGLGNSHITMTVNYTRKSQIVYLD